MPPLSALNRFMINLVAENLIVLTQKIESWQKKQLKNLQLKKLAGRRKREPPVLRRNLQEELQKSRQDELQRKELKRQQKNLHQEAQRRLRKRAVARQGRNNLPLSPNKFAVNHRWRLFLCTTFCRGRSSILSSAPAPSR